MKRIFQDIPYILSKQIYQLEVKKMNRTTTIILGLILVCMTIGVASASLAVGPAPNSGDGISDGSGMDQRNGNEVPPGSGPAPNSGNGIPDGSGF